MRGGLIVRLIDVVLIILFGFIAISDIQVKRQIRLPGPSQKEEKPQEENEFIFVKIDRKGKFLVEVENKRVLKSRDLNKLRKCLVKTASDLSREKKRPVVIIDPEAEAILQTTIDVFDICEEENLPKSIHIGSSLE